MANFLVDSCFARFGDTRYATDKITSFSVDRQRRSVQGNNDRFSAVALGAVGLIAGLILISSGFGEGNGGRAVLGLALLTGSGWALWKAKSLPPNRSHGQTVYTLMIVTNAGETAAYETTSAEEITEVETALEQAILSARR